MFFSKINPKQAPAGSHFRLQMNRCRAEKQQQMPQSCSAGSRGAAVCTGLTPGVSNPGGRTVSSWPGAVELHPADACCCFFPSPWVHPSGEARRIVGLWGLKEKARLSFPFTFLELLASPARAWDGHRFLQKGGQGLCWALSGLSGAESKAGLPVTCFTYSTAHSFLQLTHKGKQLGTVGSQEACHLPPCATNLHRHLPPCARTPLSPQREGAPPETSSAWALLYFLREPLHLGFKTFWTTRAQITSSDNDMQKPWTQSSQPKPSTPSPGLTTSQATILSHRDLPSGASAVWAASAMQPAAGSQENRELTLQDGCPFPACLRTILCTKKGDQSCFHGFHRACKILSPRGSI